MSEPEERAISSARKAPPSLLKTLLAKGQSAKDALTHDGNNASIILDDKTSRETPWTPKSLGRAKTAIIYKQTLNDTLLVLERNIFFISGWVPYFVSLQEDSILVFTSRERWEQGLKPDKIIELHHMMLLGDMKVDVVDGYSSLHDESGNLRLFRRKLLETDELDEWLNEELRQSLVVSSGSTVNTLAANNPNASTHSILEFGSYSQNTFELWTKAIRHILVTKREEHASGSRGNQPKEQGDEKQSRGESTSTATSSKSWVSPGQDSKVTLLQSELWCHRVLSGEKEKAESEIRRIVAMEKLVAQVTHPQMALLVYEKVSRVHELFSANCRREIDKRDGRETPMSTEVLNFFADHLKRKYSVFLILALAYGVQEEEIREAHERMCLENAAENAGVGGGSGEQQRTVASYGFEDPESLELYEKYRDAALNYHKMNYGDTAAAEEEDAIMHLPVMLQVAVVRQDLEESSAMLSILNTVKARLMAHCAQENDS
ncbi:hypothetical protein PF008_g4135 [Phytophthora fragariae]|uniref:PH domain-containing protein n=1 Tax=Phytophthora fragariae TaxID=53985 RepID=A0A6G0SCG3_9STRA|nr:hypothetical protein PF008_g4135 [Phytophthora fragariae]